MNFSLFNTGSSPPDSNMESPLLQVGLPLAVFSYMAMPAISRKVGGAVDQIWQGISFFKQKAETGFGVYAPQSVKKIAELTGNLLNLTGKAAYYGIVTLDEMIDFANMGGTKNPLASIDASYQRLRVHDQYFAECCEFLADQAVQYYAQTADEIKEIINEAISDYPFSGGVNWFVEINQELIEQTIKANILHLLANLADQAFDQNHPFADRQRNPLGRLVSVVVNCLEKHEDCLADIAQLPKDQQERQYREAFQEISSDLLEKFFPNGAKDLQLFHHTLPVKGIKDIIWHKINQELPTYLELLYLQTRPLNEEKEDWKDQFDDEAYGFEADQLLQLPSTLLQYFIKSNQAKTLDDLKPAFESFLEENGLARAKARYFSFLLIKYAREFLLTKDPALHKIGAFFERYLMEHLLFNLSEFVPDDIDVDIHMPIYILKQWIKGDLFKMLSSALTGKIQQPEDQANAIRELLAPFGLDQKETFPLPPVLKEKAWPVIQNFQEEKLPSLVAKLIPQWMVLSKMGQHQSELNSWLDDDSSLTNSFSNLIGMIADKGMLYLPQANLSIGQQLNDLFPSAVLSQDQQKKLDVQWEGLLKEKESLDILQDFGEQCLEALVLQLCKDLYSHYQETTTLDSLDLLSDDVDGEEGEEAELSFAAWLLLEVVNACNQLSIEGASDDDLAALQEAIHLKNVICNSKDLVQAKQDRDELEKLWSILRPKFDYLCQHLLGILGYQRAADLPFPEQLQPMIWKQLMAILPYVLFEHSSNLMLPLLEKQELQEQVLTLPQGAFIKQGCQLLAQDIIQHLPDWVDGKIESLPKQLMEEMPEFDLSNKTQEYLVNTLNAVVQVDDPAYEPLWQWVQSYLEGLFLKVAVKVGQMDQQDLNAIQSLIQTTRNDLLDLEQKEDGDEDFDKENDHHEEKLEDKHDQEVGDVLIEFTDQFFACLGIQTNQDLFGVPTALQEPVLRLVREKFAQVLLGIYHVENKIRHHVVASSPIEEQLPASRVASASLFLTRLILDKVADTLTERVDGEAEVIDQLYDSLKTSLSQQEEEGYQIATLLQTLIDQQIPTPFLLNLFDLLNTDPVQKCKQNFADWINPLLTDQVIKHLTPLLKKEEEKQAAFDHDLLVALLPVLVRHFKHLNQASSSLGGLNFENFLDVAGNDLHPAVSCIKDEEQQYLQRKDNFCKKQVDLIFELIFPNGKEDLAKITPEIKLTDEQWASVSDSVEDLFAMQLPKAFDALFNKEKGVEIFNSLFEILTEQTEIGTQDQSEEHLKELQRELAQIIVTDFFPHFGALIEKATDVFTNPVLKSLRKAILAIGSFVMVRLIGSTLRFLKIERFVVNRLHGMIQYASKKSIAVFFQPKLHEDAIYHLVEAFEKFLIDQVDISDQPIKINSPKNADSLAEEEPLTEEERQSQMDQLLGELVIEVARFVDLPVDRIENLPGWANHLMGIDGIRETAYQSIGASMREHLNGEFVAKTFQLLLSNMEQQDLY